MIPALPCLFDGMGGLNLSNIQVILDEEEVPKGAYRRWLFSKVLSVSDVINKARAKERKK